MDNDSFEEEVALTRADDRKRPGRCAWVALVLVVMLIPGIFPGSFIGGLVSMKAVEQLLGRQLVDGLAGRMIVLAGMAGGFLAASAVLLFMTMTIRRMTRDLVRWFTVAARKPSV